MTDSFFGLENDIPSFGDTEKHGHEDEIDLMNDETFGDAAVADDWEDAHEKLKDAVEGSKLLYGDALHETKLEHAVEKLVVDEDAKSRGQPIPKRHASDLSDLFGPSSPQGLLNTDELIQVVPQAFPFPGPTQQSSCVQVRGKENIWGSPSKDGPHYAPPTHYTPATHRSPDPLQSLLNQFQTPARSYHQDPLAEKILSSSLPQMKRPADLDHPVLGPAHLAQVMGSAPPRVLARPRAMTVEELERELVGGEEPRRGSGDGQMIGGQVQILKRTSPPMSSPTLGTPPPGQGYLRQQLPAGLAPTALAQVLASANVTTNSPQSQMPHRVSPPNMRQTPPPVMPPMPGPHGDTRQTTRSPLLHESFDAIRSPHPRGPPLMYRGGPSPHHFPPHRGAPRPHFPGPFNGFPPGMPPGMPPPFRGGFDPMMRPMRGEFRGRGRPRGRGWGHQGGGHYSEAPPYEEEEEEPNKDDYAGLMSEREKDWVTKIQLRQLQTDNPYLDDFYYTSIQMKKIAQEKQKQDVNKAKAKLVIPQIARIDSQRAYIPLQFEGTLGRLTASSVHNPRRIIDVSTSSLHEQDEARGGKEGGRRFRQLLLSIEYGFDTLLDVDELEKRAFALPDEAREEVLEARRKKTHQLYTSIMEAAVQKEAFSRLLAVRKGIKLVARLLLLLDVKESSTLTIPLLSQLTVLTKKEWHLDVWPLVVQCLSEVFHASDLQYLGQFTTVLMETNDADQKITDKLASYLQTPLGASVVWCLVSRGEDVYSTVSPVDMPLEQQETWSSFVSELADTIESISKEKLAKPISGGHYQSVSSHFKRMVGKLMFESIEDKLQVLTTDNKE